MKFSLLLPLSLGVNEPLIPSLCTPTMVIWIYKNNREISVIILNGVTKVNDTFSPKKLEWDKNSWRFSNAVSQQSTAAFAIT